MGTYIVGDIHGCFPEWIKLKDRIEAEDPNAVFVLIGDIIDRGPHVDEMMDWAIEHISKNGKYQMVLGNHEYDKLKFMFFGIGKLPTQRKEFFEKQSFVKEFDIEMKNKKQHFIIVHGGIKPEWINQEEHFIFEYIGEDNQDYAAEKMIRREELVWKRYEDGLVQTKNSIIVHGHTPTIFREDISDRVVPGHIYYENRNINIDCGMVYHDKFDTANLAALRLEDLKEFYIKEETFRFREKYKMEIIENQNRRNALIDEVICDLERSN